MPRRAPTGSPTGSPDLDAPPLGGTESARSSINIETSFPVGKGENVLHPSNRSPDPGPGAVQGGIKNASNYPQIDIDVQELHRIQTQTRQVHPRRVNAHYDTADLVEAASVNVNPPAGSHYGETESPDWSPMGSPSGARSPKARTGRAKTARTGAPT